MKYVFACLLFVSTLTTMGQYRQLSPQAEISILTVGPGKNLYDCFGHSAFRIVDPASGLDLAYNYGMFDTDAPNFYLKFSMSTAQYWLAAYRFDYFLQSYQRQNRWITEQVLNLTLEEKQQIFEKLEDNRRPENKFYRYDQFYDNCATRMRDLVSDALGDNITFSADHLDESTSLRDLVDENTFNFPWWDFGIDVALGSPLDGAATPAEHMFLPDYVMQGFDNATIQRNGTMEPAVKEKINLFETTFYEQSKETLSPVLIFALVALVIILITFLDFKRNKRSRWLDFSLMLITGLIGVVILFLWFATYHSTAAKNLNLLWAFFPNLYVAFLMLKKQPPAWVRSYARILFILLLAMSFVWLLGLQVFSTAMIPIMVFLAARYVFLWQRALKNDESEAA